MSNPLANLSACCSGAVEVYNSCFQYCNISVSAEYFDNCAVANVYSPVGIIHVNCNKPAKSGAGKILRKTRWNLTGLVLALMGLQMAINL